MIFYWLIFSIIITVIGTVMIIFLEQDKENFAEEVDFEERNLEQRAALTVAECEIDAQCEHQHELAEKRVNDYQKKKKR